MRIRIQANGITLPDPLEMTAETLVYARRKLSSSLPVRPKIGSALMRRNMKSSPMSVSFDSALSSLVKHSFLDKTLVASENPWEAFVYGSFFVNLC